MRRRIALVTAVFLALAASALPAQESEGGQLWQVRTWRIAPEHVITFTQAIGQMVEAAKQANLAPEWGWVVWSDFPNFTVVNPMPNMAALDDQGAWTRQFEGTPGQATLEAAMQSLEPVISRITEHEIMEPVPAWSYAPEGGADWQTTGAEVLEYWVKPGKMEQFEQHVGEFMAMFKEMNYPYPISGNRVRMGETDKRTWVIFYDSRENYYGKNSTDRLLEQHGLAERWQQNSAGMLSTIADHRNMTLTYAENMSYQPEGN